MNNYTYNPSILAIVETWLLSDDISRLYVYLYHQQLVVSRNSVASEPLSVVTISSLLLDLSGNGVCYSVQPLSSCNALVVVDFHDELS